MVAARQRDPEDSHTPLAAPPAGAVVFESLPPTFAEPFHPAVPRGMTYLPGRNQDWSNYLDE